MGSDSKISSMEELREHMKGIREQLQTAAKDREIDFASCMALMQSTHFLEAHILTACNLIRIADALEERVRQNIETYEM